MQWRRILPSRGLFGAMRPAWHVRRAARGLVRLVFPPRCAGCDGELHDGAAAWPLCEACRARLAPGEVLRCARCGAAAGRSAGDTAAGCDDCRQRSLGFDRAWVWGDYVGELRAAVLRMKHAHDEPLTAALGHMFAGRLAEPLRAWRVDLVVSVPMHWSRRFARGTNSPEILAEILAAALGVSLGDGVVSRRRRTQPQAGLAPTQRFDNVHGAFRLAPGVALAGARVLVVDDVLTTGATCGEVARLLKRAGAEQVGVAVIARAPRPE